MLFLDVIIALIFCSLSLPTPLYAQQSLVFSTVDNPHTIGFEQEILQQAYQRLGIDISVIGMPSERALRSSNTGLTDGEMARIATINQVYPNLIRIDVPVRIDPMHLYVRAGDEFVVDGWGSIPKNYLLGYRRGNKLAEYAAAEHDIRTVTNKNMIQLFEQLSRNRIDAVFAGPFGIEIILSEPQIKNIVALDPPVHINALYHFLNKRHTQLVPEITRVLQEMAAEGKIQQIREKYENKQSLGTTVSESEAN